MQFTLAILSALAAASVVVAQGVTAVVTPSSPAPSGCSSSYSGTFEITVVLPSKKRDVVEKRDACGGSGVLVATLSGGVLHDANGRVGAIVANHQFQFDGPPSQAGSIYTGGFSVCGNGSLALGGSAVFYQCLSGTFYNLYDKSIGGQCQMVLIQVLPCGTVAQGTDGQPTGASATVKATQISDGQIQASSAKSMAPVSQFTDGQLQATAKATVTGVGQISDGQVQASAASTLATSTKPAVVSQISDGQIQATSAATSKPAVVSQISDGQVQASAATSSKAAVPVSQISDGQIQASATPAATTASAAAASTSSSRTAAAATASFTGGAARFNAGPQVALGAVAFAAMALL